MYAIFQMGSRLTWQVAGILTMVAGIFGKFGAALASIPEPVLGGIMIVVFGMVVAVGLSNLQFVDLESSRNLTILGVSFMLGMMIPEWMKKNQGAIRTGRWIDCNIADHIRSMNLIRITLKSYLIYIRIIFKSYLNHYLIYPNNIRSE